jgi:phosphoribosylanthranilate isomerase
LSARVRVKICGITRLEDALAAVASGADAIGFVFYPPSPRFISPDAAAAIARQLPPFVTTVGLFVNQTEAAVRQVLAQVPLGQLQFHGEEDDAFCARFGRPWLKALAVKAGSDVAAQVAAHPGASGLLLDAWHPQLKGGTGECFDWSLFPEDCGKPLVLAGGLTPGNVAEAIRVTSPYAVDVSGGVEALAADGTVRKGIKDAGLIKAFIAAVNTGVVKT